MRKTPVSNYAYACTRARAKKKKLISPNEYSRLASMDLASMARYIGETQYRSEIEEFSPQLSGSELIETATYLNLATTYRQVIGFCQGEARVILHHYLNELDLQNLKTVIRGKFHHATNEDIKKDLIPGGAYTSHLESIWMAADDVPELIRSLTGSHFHEEVSKALVRDPEINTLIYLEDAVDKGHYAHLLGTMSGRGTGTSLFRDFIKREIDMRNILSLFRIRMDSDLDSRWKAEDIFIPGGQEFTLEALAQMYSTSNPKQLFSSMEKLSFYEAIEPYVAEAIETRSPAKVIRAIEKHHRKGAGQFAKRYPLSILPIIHYLMLKRNEVTTLRLIARGKFMGLDPDTIRGLLT